MMLAGRETYYGTDKEKAGATTVPAEIKEHLRHLALNRK